MPTRPKLRIVGSHALRALKSEWSVVRRLAVSLGLCSAAFLLAGPARAEDSDGHEGILPIEIHGFVSQGFIKTTANNYLADSKRGSFEFTEVGLNFTKDLTDRMRVGMQIFTHDLGPLGNYQTRFDWFYLDYKFWDWFGVRAGRTKVPFGLYNETNDIDAARVPILLPQSVYPVSNREFLLAQTGAEVYGNIPLGSGGSLEYRLYGGTLFIDAADANTTGTNFTVPYIVGGRLMWQTPLEGLQVGGSVQKLRIDADLPIPAAEIMQLQMAGELPANFSGTASLQLPALLAVGSAEYSAHDLLLASEYSRWRLALSSSVPAFTVPTTTSERFYVMAAYHVTPWFTPAFGYSALFSNVDDRSGHDPAPGSLPGTPPLGRGAYQHDVSATLRFDINPYWLLKLEGHAMHGTAGLDSTLNGNQPLSSLTQDWGVLLVKTTAYF
jgi:hypothetical protein